MPGLLRALGVQQRGGRMSSRQGPEHGINGCGVRGWTGTGSDRGGEVEGSLRGVVRGGSEARSREMSHGDAVT